MLEEETIGDRKEALKHLPNELQNTYKETLARIQALKPKSRAERAMCVLLWTFLQFPTHGELMSIKELQHALAVKVSDKEFDKDRIPSLKVILGNCLGLVTVDKETSTVRLVHYTLQEYFKKHESIIFPEGHQTMARICLTYLGFSMRRPIDNPVISEKLKSNVHTMTPSEFQYVAQPALNDSFLKYAFYQWGHHMRRQSNVALHTFMLNLLQTSYTTSAVRVLYSMEFELNPVYRWLWWNQSVWGDHLLNEWNSLFGVPKGSLIHIAAYFGLNSLAGKYRDEKPRQGDGNRCARSPQSIAASSGHEKISRLLLALPTIDPNSADRWGRTPLSHAAKNGHDSVVQLLLALPTIDPNSADIGDWTPLTYAAEEGHDSVVQLLLALPAIDPNCVCGQDRTPLSYAAEGGHDSVVQLLLAHPTCRRNVIRQRRSTSIGRSTRWSIRRSTRGRIRRSTRRRIRHSTGRSTRHSTRRSVIAQHLALYGMLGRSIGAKHVIRV